MTLPISIACWDYDRARALMNGTVGIEGCAPTFIPLGPEEAFFRAFRHQEFDVTELSFSTYTLATSRGNCPYLAIPVFISRAFRHSGIYIRTDRGIKSAADLKGKLVGVPEYQMTAAVWIRGILEDIYGVPAREVRWRSGGQEEPGRHEKFELKLSKDIEVKAIPDGETLNAMFERGELDAITSARAPTCYVKGAPNIARLFPDFRQTEKEYFRTTGIFPIMHAIGIRKTLLEKEPWIAASLFKAFSQSKAACMPSLTEVAALKITLPWIAQEAEDTMAVMGKDFWPYGVPANRKTLDAFVRYHHTQGLSDRQMRMDELFVASTLEQAKI